MADGKIDPWGAVDIGKYDKNFEQFGVKRFPDEWKSKLDHPLFRRGIIIAHRDFDKVVSRIESKQPFIMMTGIATSGNMHFGHKTIVDLVNFFKSKGAKTYFGIADIDAYCSRADEKVPTLQAAKEFAVNNLANVLALGLTKKDVYVQSRMPSRYYEFTFELSKKITANTFEGIYGHLDLGKVSANLLQYADILHPQLKEFEGKMPSVTPVGMDQDPHMRAVRDLVHRLKYPMELPSSIYPAHEPGLKEGMKMSSSIPESAIFLTDSPEAAKAKIMKAFSGGKVTVEEHRKLGGDPEVDRAYQMLKYHHPDDKKVEKIFHDFKSGKLLSGELKEICAEFVLKFLKEHQKKYKKFEPVAREMVFGD